MTSRIASYHPFAVVVQNRGFQHLIFWGLSFYILLTLFAYDKEEIERVDWVYTTLFHLTLLPAVYLNLFWLIPKLLRKNYFFAYLMAVIATIGGSIYFHQFVFDYLADRITPGYYFISYYNNWEIARFTGIYLGVSSLLKLSKSWFRVNENEKQLAKLRGEKLDAELHALKTQIDPHFLFNSLNTLYSLAIESDAKTPEYIMKLSENLRYILYECSEKQIPVEKEIRFIENYLSLQRLRSDRGNLFKLTCRNLNPDLQVAPLMFIPFIENAFKHGDKKKKIHIVLRQEGQKLQFQVENYKSMTRKVKFGSGGIGIANTRKRLRNLYPKKHELIIDDGKEKFCIHLELQLV